MLRNAATKAALNVRSFVQCMVQALDLHGF